MNNNLILVILFSICVLLIQEKKQEYFDFKPNLSHLMGHAKDGAKDVAEDVIKPVKDLVNKTKDFGKSIERNMNKKMNLLVDKAINPVVKPMSKVINKVKDVPGVINKQINKLGDKIKNVFKKIIGKITSVMKKIVNKIKEIPKKIKKILDKILDKLKEAFENVIDGFENIGEFFEKIGKTILGVIIKVFGVLGGVFGKVFGAVFNVGKAIFWSVYNVIVGKFPIIGYIPYIIGGFIVLPFFLLFLVLATVLSPLLGWWAYLLPFGFVAGLPFMLKYAFEYILDMIMEIDVFTMVGDAFRKSPELIKKVTDLIFGTIRGAFDKIKLDIGAGDVFKNIVKKIKDLINKILGIKRDQQKEMDDLSKDDPELDINEDDINKDIEEETATIKGDAEPLEGDDLGNVNFCVPRSTDNQELNDMRYLDRHTLDCGENAAMGKMALNTFDNEANFDYTCCNVDGDRRDVYTSMRNHGDSSFHYMDGHNINCKDDEVINNVKQETHGEQMRYKFKCIKPKSEDGKVLLREADKHTPWIERGSDTKGSNVRKLKYSMDCGDKYLSSFKMETSGSKTRYRYNCSRMTTSEDKKKVDEQNRLAHETKRNAEDYGGKIVSLRAKSSFKSPNGFCLDTSHDYPKNGTKPHQWDCNGENANQYWEIVKTNEPNMVSLKSAGRCLDTNQKGTGKDFYMWDCNGGDAQKFQILDKDSHSNIPSGYVVFKHKFDGKCLDNKGSSSSRSNYHTGTCINENQQFKVTNRSHSQLKKAEKIKFIKRLVNYPPKWIWIEDSNKCMDTSTNVYNGRKIKQESCKSGNNNQKFEILHTNEPNMVSLKARGKCIDTSKSGEGHDFYLWDCNGGDAQKFEVLHRADDNRIPDGKIMFKHKGSGGKCIDNTGNHKKNIKTWSCDPGNNNQRFQLKEY